MSCSRTNDATKAHALATPVRDCPVTDSLLPRFFFIPFDPKPHPDAPTEWHLLPSTLFAQSSPRTPNDAAVRSPQMYVSGRAALLRFMKARQKGTRRVEKWKDLNTAVIKWLAKVKVTHLHLNPDIDDLVLNLLQESVVSALKWPLQRPNAGYIETADKGIDAIDEIDDVACILYVDSPKSPEVEDLERQVQLCLTKCDGFVNTIDRWQNVLIGGGKEIMREWAAETEAPQLVPRLSAHYSLPRLRFPTVAYRGRKVPVYSLQDLLGVDRTRRLLEGTRFGDAKYLVIKESTQGSYKGQEQLLRLQGYLQ